MAPEPGIQIPDLDFLALSELIRARHEFAHPEISQVKFAPPL